MCLQQFLQAVMCLVKVFHIYPWQEVLLWICEGEYKFDRLRENGLLKLQQYGQLVREDIVPGVSVVWVYTPEDIETVYRCEVLPFIIIISIK